jgi:hypothetical protein
LVTDLLLNKKGAAGLALVALVALAASSAGHSNRFDDVTGRTGIHLVNQASHTSHKYLPETMVGGVALFDYNNDGLLDIFFVNGAALADPMPAGARPDKSAPKYWNRLYRNNGDGSFTDVTEQAGLQGNGFGMGVAVADFDNDGYEDLYVTNVGKNIFTTTTAMERLPTSPLRPASAATVGPPGLCLSTTIGMACWICSSRVT